MTPGMTTLDVWDSIVLDLVSIQVEGRIVYINTAGAKMLGAATPGQVVGKPILDFVHPAYREIATERVRQMTTDGIVICPSEERWLRLDGTVIDVDVAVLPVFYEGKLAVQIIAREDSREKSCQPVHNRRSTHRSWRKRHE